MRGGVDGILECLLGHWTQGINGGANNGNLLIRCTKNLESSEAIRKKKKMTSLLITSERGGKLFFKFRKEAKRRDQNNILRGGEKLR